MEGWGTKYLPLTRGFSDPVGVPTHESPLPDPGEVGVTIRDNSQLEGRATSYPESSWLGLCGRLGHSQAARVTTY
eukprot:15457784-Alexandrium_andersonii.AAC.1